jgi:hypothetical protein
MGMITPEIVNGVTAISKKLTRDWNAQQDCIQVGLTAILQAKEGQTKSWYLSLAKWRAQDHLRKEKKYLDTFVPYSTDDDVTKEDEAGELNFLRRYYGFRTFARECEHQ